jgi:GPH family glycoside/pentoside/hexuronide:cation symporter
VAIALSAARILPTAIAADITDLDEKITGQRREGSFYAFWGLLDQLASGVGSALLPLFLLLGRSKADPHGPLGVRLLELGGGLLLFLGFLILRKYPHKDT